MEYHDNRDTKISIGVGVPNTKDLASAVAIASMSVNCLIETMGGVEKTRSTIDIPEVHCDEAIKSKEAGSMEISNFTAEGTVIKSDEFDAFYALANSMIDNNTVGTIVITDPNGTDKLWFEIVFIKVTKPLGSAGDKQKFAMEAIVKTRPKAT